MLMVLAVFLMILGVFFLSLGMLFWNYDLSPFKFLVKREDVYKNMKLSIQIITPGLVLFWLALKVLSAK